MTETQYRHLFIDIERCVTKQIKILIAVIFRQWDRIICFSLFFAVVFKCSTIFSYGLGSIKIIKLKCDVVINTDLRRTSGLASPLY